MNTPPTTDPSAPNLSKELEQLSVIDDELLSASTEITRADGGRFFAVDYLSHAAINRSLNLSSGFRLMVEARNLVCVGALLRLQLDTAVRYAAISLVEDTHDFATAILRGRQVRNLKDRLGNRMTDRYLVETFSDNAPWLRSVYERTSGYIHLSNIHIHQTMRLGDGDGKLQIQVGGRLPDRFDPVIAEAAGAFNACGRMFLHYLAIWCITKIQGGEERDRSDTSNHPKGQDHT